MPLQVNMEQKNSPTPTAPPRENRKLAPLHVIFLLVLLQVTPPVAAQPNPNNNFNDNNNPLGLSNFSPSMAIIIVVLVAALFFMGFFSIYIRHCSDNSGGNSVRNGLAVYTRRANAASRGLEAAVVETFPTFTYAEVKDHKIGKGALECAVCLNEFEDSEMLRLIPKCDHVFHPECIDAWLSSHVTCPVCRADLTPKPEDESFHMPDVEVAGAGVRAGDHDENPESNNNPPARNDEIAVQIPINESQQSRPEETKPAVKRNFSFDFVKRPPRVESIKRGGRFPGFGRSHSTGHSLVQPGENLERFRLRLPEGVRKEMMNRALLNRTKSLAVGSAYSRRGSTRPTGFDEGSSRGGRSHRKIERGDRVAISDRWVFPRAPSFLFRAASTRSPKITAENGGGEGSTSSKSVKGGPTRIPSFKCLEPKTADEAALVGSDSARPPV